MFFYINFSNGRATWYSAPLVLFLLNPSLLWRLADVPLALLSACFGTLPWLGGRGVQQQHPFDVVVNVLLCLLLAWVVYKLMKMCQDRGVWRTLHGLLLTGLRGETGRRTQQPQNGRGAFERVAECIQKLPVASFKTPEELKKLPVRELKERLASLKVDASTMKEKSELVDALVSGCGSTDASCSICCEDYQSGDALRVLPCGHKFHLQCIDRWFLSSTDYSRPVACPYCNTPLLKGT